MKGVARLIVRYQAFLFYALVCFEGVVLKFSGIRYMFTNRPEVPHLRADNDGWPHRCLY